jgi:hypothetical protein
VLLQLLLTSFSSSIHSQFVSVSLFYLTVKLYSYIEKTDDCDKCEAVTNRLTVTVSCRFSYDRRIRIGAHLAFRSTRRNDEFLLFSNNNVL